MPRVLWRFSLDPVLQKSSSFKIAAAQGNTVMRGPTPEGFPQRRRAYINLTDSPNLKLLDDYPLWIPFNSSPAAILSLASASFITCILNGGALFPTSITK